MDSQVVAEAMHQAVEQGIAPGMVVAALQEDGDPHVLAAGWRALAPRQEPMLVDTLFDLASLTKVLATTTLCMLLVQRGLLDLDAPLARLDAGLVGGRVGQLTPRLLLLHAAGFPPSITYYKGEPPRVPDGRARRERVLQAIGRAELAYEPGTECRYSDVGMMLLGALLERISGCRLDHLFEREVAQPLGLRDTFYRHLEEPLAKACRPPEAFAATEACSWRGEIVRGWVHDENAYLLLGVAGHAGLFATATDVLRLASTLLSAWSGASEFVGRDTVRQFVRRHDEVPGSDRALGWGTATAGASCGSRFSPASFGHTGFTGTSVWIDPEARRVVVLLANRIHPSRDNAAFLQFRPGFHDLVVEAMES